MIKIETTDEEIFEDKTKLCQRRNFKIRIWEQSKISWLTSTNKYGNETA